MKTGKQLLFYTNTNKLKKKNSTCIVDLHLSSNRFPSNQENLCCQSKERDDYCGNTNTANMSIDQK